MQLKLHLPFSAFLLIVISCAVNASSQDMPGGWVLTRPNQEVRVEPLPSIVADSKSASDVMLADVAIAVMDPNVCCGRKSALEDQADLPEGASLKELGEKLRGKHYLDSGEKIVVADYYWSGASVNAESIVNSLVEQNPLLMDWNGHLYVVYGAEFDEYAYSSGGIADVIQKLLLVDSRYAGKRRYLSFDRQTDDWGKVTGVLELTITR
jgi:hypothetical protein